MSFTEIADQRLLPSVKTHTGELTWDVENDLYLRMSPDDLDGMFLLLARRGLDPALIAKLFDLFPERPIERALIAWDIFHGSLLGPGDTELVHRLANEIAPLKQLGATIKAAVPRERISTLIELARPSKGLADLMDDFKGVPSLAGLLALNLAQKTFENDDALQKITIAYAQQLAMSHLPSLAMAILQVMWDRFGSQPALDVLVEIALDYDLLDAVPQMPEEDDVSMRRQTYLEIRAKLAAYDAIGATTLVAMFEEAIPAFRKTATPQLVLACTDLDMLMSRKIHQDTLAGIQKFAPPDSRWRYAARVRDSVVMQTKSHLAGPLVEGSIPTFGNDVRLWRCAAVHPEARTELMALLSREIRYVSHEPDVWRTLAFFVSDALAVEAEIQQRLTSQLESALA